MDLSAYYGQSIQQLTGLNPGTASGAPEMAPKVSHTMGDKGALPWHPDSPQFWLLLLLGGTVFGIVGASVQFRAGPARAGASLGKKS